MQDIKFTKKQNAIWHKLFTRQIGNVAAHACSFYKAGFDNLTLPSDKVPSLDLLNGKITPKTGWRVIRTPIRYSDTLPWYQHFARREFIITNYLRSEKEIDYTPEPDMFHDIFGHLPFLTLPAYTGLLDIFTKAYFTSNAQGKEDIKRLGWFTYEFGLIRQKGKVKVFGTGIMSSKGEMEHVMSGKTPILPFSVGAVLTKNKAIDTFNKELFVFDSLDALKEELSAYFQKIKVRGSELFANPTIEDREMDLSTYKNQI